MVRVDFPSPTLWQVLIAVRKQLGKLALQLLPNLLSLPTYQTSLFFTWNTYVPQSLKGLMKTLDISTFGIVLQCVSDFYESIWYESSMTLPFWSLSDVETEDIEST